MLLTGQMATKGKKHCRNFNSNARYGENLLSLNRTLKLFQLTWRERRISLQIPMQCHTIAISNQHLILHVKHILRCNSSCYGLLCNHPAWWSRNRPVCLRHKSIWCSLSDAEQSGSSKLLFPLLESAFCLTLLFTFPLLATSGVLWQILFSGWLLSTGKLRKVQIHSMLPNRKMERAGHLWLLVLLQYNSQLFAHSFFYLLTHSGAAVYCFIVQCSERNRFSILYIFYNHMPFKLGGS